MKLKANTRFLNVFDGKIYDKGDEFAVNNDTDRDYFINHKIGSEIKETKKEPEKKVIPEKKTSKK